MCIRDRYMGYFSVHPLLSVVYFERAAGFGRYTRLILLFSSVFAHLGLAALLISDLNTYSSYWYAMSLAVVVCTAVQSYLIFGLMIRARQKATTEDCRCFSITGILIAGIIVICTWSVVIFWKMDGFRQSDMVNWLLLIIVSMILDYLLLDCSLVLLLKHNPSDSLNNFLQNRGFLASSRDLADKPQPKGSERKGKKREKTVAKAVDIEEGSSKPEQIPPKAVS
eukprot:TRINITY_DN9298_c0_g2_i4.p1 TRINITY_DN9298_c0_g2~~TRINITY_DN9298_c0_g2_i4.p1  ORF type:complete len:224 (+),score=38.59 TRINITY_DN9298_c0_g2_i4:66-737(+)